MREKMNVTPVGEYPENGLYDIFLTINTNGRLETTKYNSVPQTWERARQWVKPMLRLMHTCERFGAVEDISIVRIADGPYFTTDMRRDIWLMAQVCEMDKRRQRRRLMEIAEVRANCLLMRDDFDRAQEHIAEFVEVSVEILMDNPTAKERQAVTEALDTMEYNMRPFTQTAEVEAAAMRVAAV